MDLNNVDAVFQFVILADGLGGQLALLADRHKAAMEAVGHRAAQDKAARLDAGDGFDSTIDEGSHQLLDASLEPIGVTEQRRDIAEQDAGFGMVRYRPNEVLDIVS